MRKIIRKKRVLVNPKRMVITLLMLALTVVGITITIPIDKYNLNKDNNNFLEAKASANHTPIVNHQTDIKNQFPSAVEDDAKLSKPSDEENKDDSKSNNPPDKEVENQGALANPPIAKEPKNELQPLINNYQASFHNDLFIGDSITEGLSFYDYLDESIVISRLGLTLIKAQNELDKVEMLQPRSIYIMFGANDIDGVLTDARFINNYVQLISTIKEKSPESIIHVQSILPVSNEMAQKKPHLNQAHINQLNTELMAMTKAEGVEYVNIAAILNNMSQDIYEPDGIHLKSNFYPLWLDYLLTNVEQMQ